MEWRGAQADTPSHISRSCEEPAWNPNAYSRVATVAGHEDQFTETLEQDWAQLEAASGSGSEGGQPQPGA